MKLLANPEFYANMYRRYQTYCRNYGDNKLFKIACGPNVDDYYWTEGVMKVAALFMDGLVLHCYTHPVGWQYKGPAGLSKEKAGPQGRGLYCLFSKLLWNLCSTRLP